MNLQNFFPSFLHDDFELLYKLLPQADLSAHIGNRFALVGDEKVVTNGRIYCQYPEASDRISDIQQKMLDCLFTKHHNGFVREKFLKKIIDFDDEWVPPFVFALLGEYVIEIIEIINQHRKALTNKHSYRQFVRNNSNFMNLIKDQIISYWDCYYRYRYKYKEDYPGLTCLNYMIAQSRS